MIEQRDLNGNLVRTFKSGRQAGRILKISKTEINEAVRTGNSFKGFFWVRKNEAPPKVLVFDVESSPSVVYTFSRFNTSIGINQVIKDPIMLTWAAKWLGDVKIMSDAITPKEVLKFNDKRIVSSLWKLFNEADIVIAHYGDKFDIPLLNARAILNGLPPFSPVKSIDTKQAASRHFKFPSNKLDAIASYFGVGQKIKTDFDLWKHCLEGDPQEIKNMEAYNIQDVVVLEEVYLKLRPYITNHPNLGIYLESDKMVCRVCGSDHLKAEGYYRTQVSKYPAYRCECGAVSRGRKTIYPKEKKGNLLTNINRF